MFSKKKKCLRCDSSWVSRVKKPVQCPRCKSPFWNKKRKREDVELIQEITELR